MTRTTKTVSLTFWYDRADPNAKGWAYAAVVDGDHESGPVDVTRETASLTTVRRAFFRTASKTSTFGRLRLAFARADWKSVDGGWKATVVDGD